MLEGDSLGCDFFPARQIGISEVVEDECLSFIVEPDDGDCGSLPELRLLGVSGGLFLDVLFWLEVLREVFRVIERLVLQGKLLLQF